VPTDAPSRGRSAWARADLLIAGFAAGLLVAALRGLNRLFKQVRGLADGFLVPLFFIVLGARVDPVAVVEHPSILRLTVALLVLNVAVHGKPPPPCHVRSLPRPRAAVAADDHGAATA
jgi:hypothetical protein